VGRKIMVAPWRASLSVLYDRSFRGLIQRRGASSSSSTDGLARSRAPIAMRRRCPADSVSPRSPTEVFVFLPAKPHDVAMDLGPARRLPRPFVGGALLAEPDIFRTTWLTQFFLETTRCICRSDSRVTLRISTPSMVTRPSSGT